MSRMTPTQRSLALLRERGYLTAVVERWNPHAKIRQDLYGVADLIAVRPLEVMFVQTTSGDHVAERIAKVKAHANYERIIESGILFFVHGWSRLKAGWTCREIEL